MASDQIIRDRLNWILKSSKGIFRIMKIKKTFFIFHCNRKKKGISYINVSPWICRSSCLGLFLTPPLPSSLFQYAIFQCSTNYFEVFFWYLFLTHLIPTEVPLFTFWAAVLALSSPVEAAALTPAIFLLALPLLCPIFAMNFSSSSLLKLPEPHWSAQPGALLPMLVFSAVVS